MCFIDMDWYGTRESRELVGGHYSTVAQGSKDKEVRELSITEFTVRSR